MQLVYQINNQISLSYKYSDICSEAFLFYPGAVQFFRSFLRLANTFIRVQLGSVLLIGLDGVKSEQVRIIRLKKLEGWNEMTVVQFPTSNKTINPKHTGETEWRPNNSVSVLERPNQSPDCLFEHQDDDPPTFIIHPEGRGEDLQGGVAMGGRIQMWETCLIPKKTQHWAKSLKTCSSVYVSEFFRQY